MRLLETLRSAWNATRDVSAAFRAARDAYEAGEPVAGIVRAWAQNTGTEVDDRLAEQVTEYATQAVAWLQRAALVLVQVALRLEMLAPRWVAVFVGAVAFLERTVPPLLAKARAAADRAEREARRLSGTTQRASVALAHFAATVGRLKGDG